MHRLLPGVLAALVLTASGAAAAQKLPQGLYFEARAGATFLQDADNTGGGTSIESSYETGYAFGGAIGYAHMSGFRGELAVEYRQSDLDDLTITNDGGAGAALGVGSLNGISLESVGIDVGGDVSALTAMVNGYYDFDFGSNFKPFVGAGIGLAQVTADVDLSVPGLSVTIVDDTDEVFAYQGVVGVSYEFEADISATLQYSYLATSDPELKNELGGSFDSEYASHNVMVGFRFSY